MKAQILKASLPLIALSLACSPGEVGAAGIRGSILSMNEVTSVLNQAENNHRRLDEGNGGGEQKEENANEAGEEAAEEDVAEYEDEVAEYEDEAVEYDYGYEDESFETEDMQYADEDDEDTTTMSAIEKYEAQAASLFETAPADWNPGQWDLLFALFGSVLVSCCVLSAFFAYCCIFREDDDVLTKRGRSLRRRRRQKDDDTVGSHYSKETSLLPNEGSRTFSPLRSWVSGSTYFSDNEESGADESKSKKYSAPDAAAATSPTATVTSAGGFADVGEGAAILHQNTGVTQKSTVPHQNSGITMKSEVVEM